MKVRSLPDNRFLVLGPGGTVRVCRIDGSRLQVVGEWVMQGRVADAATSPDGRLLILSEEPVVPASGPTSRIDVYLRGSGPGGFVPAASFPGPPGSPVTISATTAGTLVAFGNLPDNRPTMHVYRPLPGTGEGYEPSFDTGTWGFTGRVVEVAAGADGAIFRLSTDNIVEIMRRRDLLPDSVGFTQWWGQDVGAGALTVAVAISTDAGGNLYVADDCLQTLQMVRVRRNPSYRGDIIPIASGPLEGIAGTITSLAITTKGDALVLAHNGSRSMITRYARAKG